MTLNFTRIWVVMLMIVALFTMSSCDGGGGDSSSSSSQTTLELGATATLGTIAVGINGSLLTIESPDTSMDGMKINIPPGAYQEEVNFTVSYNPIINHSGNKNLDPVTPLISIENGGEYADEIITVKIPVTIEDGYHYMAFYYDEATGALKGIPEVEHDETSLTIATRHFSMLFINRVFWELLLENFDSGFQVKQDNWQFTNLGTFLSAGGICSGMSIASLYYYDEKKKKQAYPPLYGFYDNATPNEEKDDDQAIKLCSTIQDWWRIRSDKMEYYYDKADKMVPLWTYFMFAHALATAEEPQYVSVRPKDGGYGHALVVYKKSGNDFYVADPNYPKNNNTKIEFELGADGQSFEEGLLNGKFKPYASLWNPKTQKIDFEKIIYMGKDALIDSDFDDLWNNLDNATVPWNKVDDDTLGRNFPWYQLKIIEKDDSGTEKESDLTDNYETTNSEVKIKVQMDEYDPRLTAYYAKSFSVKNIEDDTVEITLNPGDNNIGFLIEAEMHDDVFKQKEWTWTDYIYINIKLDKEVDQTTGSISVPNTLDEDIKVWISDKDGIPLNSVDAGPGVTVKQIYEPGAYKIVVDAEYISWNREISLSAGQNYVYNFESSNDCSGVKVAVFNNTPNKGYLTYLFYGDSGTLERWRHRLDANEKKDIYLNFVRASDFYLSWSSHNGDDSYETDWFNIECTKKYSWTVTGNLEGN